VSDPRRGLNGRSLKYEFEHSFAVFPEHLEVVTSSNLLKVVGHISGEMVVIEGKQRLSGWVMIMPEKPETETHVPDEASPPILDMLRWCVGIHDAFGLYGRPERYNWNPRDPASLFFGYPEILTNDVSVVAVAACVFAAEGLIADGRTRSDSFSTLPSNR
jgi:hypothetical protein